MAFRLVISFVLPLFLGTQFAHAERLELPLPLEVNVPSPTSFSFPSRAEAITIHGEPVRLVYENGREITVYAREPRHIAPEIDIKMTTNTCVRTVVPRCRVVANLIFTEVLYAWSKFPGPRQREMSGQIVLGYDKRDSAIDYEKRKLLPKIALKDTSFQTPYTPVASRPMLLREGPEKWKDAIICDDFSWLPPGTAKATPTSVPIWNTEFETGIPEFFGGNNAPVATQMFSSSKEVTLARIAEDRLRIDKVKYFHVPFAFIASTTLAYNLEINLDKAQYQHRADRLDISPRDKMCKIIFSVDFNKIFNVLVKEQAAVNEPTYVLPKDIRPLIFDLEDPALLLSPWFNHLGEEGIE